MRTLYSRLSTIAWIGPLMLVAVALGLPLEAQTTTPALTATPSAVSVTYQLGAASLPAAVNVAVRAPSGTPMLAVATPATGADWLVVSPSTAKSPATLAVRLNPTGLAAATYSTSFTVSTQDSSASPVTVTVKLTVTSPPPTMTVSPLSLNFVAPTGPTSQTVNLTSTGTTVSYTAAVTGTTWLSVAPASGVIIPGLNASLTVTVDPSGLTPQTAAYTAKITVTANNVAAASKTQTIAVSLTVNAQTPTLVSAWPAAVNVSSPLTVVTLRGTNFVPASVAKISGATGTLKTTYVMPTVVLAEIPAAALTTAGTLNLIVTNPAPGGDSTPLAFTVSSSPTIQLVASAASYQPAATVSPGELVALFGANIGPASPLLLSDLDGDSMADTTLGTYTATVDGIAAPLLLVSQNQMTIAVPFSVSLGTGKVISVSDGTNPAMTATVTINATNPGVFTMDGSGSGQAAMLNYVSATKSFTLNSSSSAATKGSVVVLYVTGMGSDYSTVPATGKPTAVYDAKNPDLAGYLNPTGATVTVPALQLTTMPTVTIGGAAATLNYAGPVAGSIMGLTQINAVVPTGSTTGNAVPVVITMGGTNSQTGLTMAVK
jgi:uncharacterized protein (TIGR03437 family)